MRIETKLTDNKFINLKEVKYPEKNVGCYQFAERLGVDSVAFICWDNDSEQFLFNKEYKPPVDEFVLGAFGGSLDQDKSLKQIVIGETLEEAGFVVDEDDVYDLGKVLVSTQMNQFCYLFLVRVNKEEQQERQPENAVEAMATVEWGQWSLELWANMEDWKPLAIVLKAQSKGILPS